MLLEKNSVGSVTSENIPIPTGFHLVSGTNKAGGFVISSVQNDDLANSQGGDQFVWIPVEQNQKLSLVVKSPEDITSIKLIDPVGDEINLGISGSIGKSFEKTNIDPTYNGVYKAEVTIGTEKTTETLLVRSLYAQDAFNDYFTDEKIEGDVYNKYNSMVGSPNNVAIVCQRLGLGENKTMDDFKAWILGKGHTDPSTNSTTNLNYATSVNTNGGFYIARYEAGSTTKRTSGNASTDGSTMNAPLSKSGVDTYNYVTRSQAIKIAEKMYSGKSYLITNAAWDRTLGWIINSNDKSLTIANVVSDSKSWGNYLDSSFSATGTGSLAQTGAFGNNTKVNNIYDLAGNVFEWTSATSPVSSSPCVIRGGYCYLPGSNHPASSRYYNDETGYGDSSGFRVALFL